MTPDPIPQPDHGAAGFCTDHGQAADRPTTVAEAVEVAYRAHLEARKGAPLAPGEFEATRSRVETKWMAAALEAIGYAPGLEEALDKHERCGWHERPDGTWVMSCGMGLPPTGATLRSAHLADVVRAWLRGDR